MFYGYWNFDFSVIIKRGDRNNVDASQILQFVFRMYKLKYLI